MNGSPGSNRVGSSCSQTSMSTKPAAVEPAPVAVGVSKWASPSQPSPIVARTRRTDAMLPPPPHWATSRPPGRTTAARLRNSASWSGTQWNVAVERIASTGSSIGSGSPRSGDDVLDPLAEPREAARGPRRSSPASRRGRRRGPRGRRPASSSVTRPLPQPASRTRSSPRSASRSSTAAPQRVSGSATRVVGPAVPVARCRHASRISTGIERPRPSGAASIVEVREELRRPGPSA